MEEPEAATPAPIINKPELKEEEESKQIKSYEITINDDTYLLMMEIISNEKINFKIRQTNNLSFYCYENKYKYEDITKILLLERNYYDSIIKIFNFCDKAINKKKVSLIIKKKNKKIIKLSLKKVMDFDEVECYLDLFEKKLTNEELIKILFNEIKEMKIKEGGNDNKNINENINENNNSNINNNYCDIIHKLVKKNEEMEKKINSIIEENIKLKNNISELQNSINELKSKNEDQQKGININDENIFKQQNLNINFYGNPQNLEFKECLTNAHSNSGWLRDFVIYTSLFDNLEYLVYNNKNNFNLDILRMKDKKIIHYLKGHKTKVSVIKYFIQNNSKEWLLSCDENRVAYCWDIRNYSRFLIIYTNYSGYIWDALILFNIFGKNYIFLPSNGLNEYTRIYEFQENASFIQNIYGTNENKTNYLIPWFYNRNYYLIECCSSKISINNIFKNEVYANLINEPEGLHCCGYLYKDNFLCVTDYNNSFVRIWDLIHKSVYKQINYDSSYGYGIIPWNDIYSIVSCSGCLVIIDIINGKMINKIILKKSNASLCGIKKMKFTHFGECIICSDTNNSIRLFILNNKY